MSMSSLKYSPTSTRFATATQVMPLRAGLPHQGLNKEAVEAGHV